MSVDLPRADFWLWMAVFAVWAISSLASKRTVGSHSEWQSRVAVWVVAIAWWFLFLQPQTGPLRLRFLPPAEAAQYAGFVLTVAGLGLALWRDFIWGGTGARWWR